MKKQQASWIIFLLFSGVFYSTSAPAFSSPPEELENYRPADWVNSQSAENDAKKAIENNDLRLLGFALKGYSIPGIEPDQLQDYVDTCGIRVFEEFGDVVRNRKQLEQMKQAQDYAIKYNTVILKSCTLAN